MKAMPERSNRPWMRSEVRFLEETLHWTDEMLASELGRTADAVRSFRLRHEIRKYKARET